MNEVEIPKRSLTTQARRTGGTILLIVGIAAASIALFSVVLFIVSVLSLT